MPKVNYSKAKKISGLHVPASATILGCGGTGAWAGLFSAIAGVKKLVLFDNAVVTETGLARLPFTPSRLGELKVRALETLVKDFRPDIEVEAYPRLFRLGADEKLISGSLLNCSDDATFSKKLSEMAARRKIRLVFAPYSGLVAGVLSRCPSDFKVDGTDGVWTGSAALAGALAVTAAFGPAFETIVNPERSRIEERDLTILGSGSSL